MKRMLGWMGPDRWPHCCWPRRSGAAAGARARRARRNRWVFLRHARDHASSSTTASPLNAEQAKVFWPLYEEYQQDLDPLYDRVVTAN